MNKEETENYKKEYEHMSLCDLADELVEPLFTVKKELAKTIYIHYAEERDKNYKLQQENKKYKEVIDKVSSQIKLYGKYNGEKCTRGFSMMTADFNKLLDILKEVNK